MKEPAENEKVTEAAMTRSIIVSVIGIVLCMACLFGTTWAWYSSSVTSGVSVTEGANFDFSIEITESVEATEGVYTFEGGEHTVTLKKKGTTEKGFCKVIATKSGEDSETTSYYIVDFTGEEPISFTVTGSGTLKLIPMLGTPAEGFDLIPNEGIALTLDSEPEEEEVVQEETTSEEGADLEEEPIDEEPSPEEETPPDETSANLDTTEQEPPTEPISEFPAEQPTEATT